MSDPLRSALETIFQGRSLSPEAALDLAALPAERLPDLLNLAAATALAAGAGRFTCTIISAKSGNCAEDCAFCAQSARHKTGAPVHPLLPSDELLRRVEAAEAKGVDYLGIVLSGTGPTERDFDRLCETARRVVDRGGVKLCASFGLIGPEQARMLREAGFTSYHHNLETARSHYPAVCTTHAYERRVETVEHVRAAGLRVCSGGLFGIGETWAQRIEFLAALRDLRVDSIPLNFLIPIPGTPLEHTPLLSPQEALRIIALARLMNPGTDIVICAGRDNVLGRWADMVHWAGAGGLMVGDFLTAKGNAWEQDRDLLELLGMR